MHVSAENGNSYTLVKVDTDTNIYGLGEVGIPMWGAAIEKAVDHLSELIIGSDPFSTENLWQHMYRRSFFPSNGVYSCAISAIDIALWDIKGKALDLPLYKLLGGPVRSKVICYQHNHGQTINELLLSCTKSVDEGWKFIRLRQPETTSPFTENANGGHLEPIHSISIAEEQVAKIRESVGPDIQILLDVHTRLDTAHAIALCKAIEPYRPFFVEDPIRSENPSSYQTLARHISIPLAAGEQWSSKWHFREVIEKELISYARIDICNVGGITEALKIAHWCETHYIDIAPHNPLGPVSTAACVALCMATSNVGVQEMPSRPGSRDVDLFPEQIGWQDGYAFSYDRPGLGIEIDMTIAETRQINPQGFPRILQRNDGALTNW